jgi:hypothetical protein
MRAEGLLVKTVPGLSSYIREYPEITFPCTSIRTPTPRREAVRVSAVPFSENGHVAPTATESTPNHRQSGGHRGVTRVALVLDTVELHDLSRRQTCFAVAGIQALGPPNIDDGMFWSEFDRRPRSWPCLSPHSSIKPPRAPVPTPPLCLTIGGTNHVTEVVA